MCIIAIHAIKDFSIIESMVSWMKSDLLNAIIAVVSINAKIWQCGNGWDRRINIDANHVKNTRRLTEYTNGKVKRCIKTSHA